MWQKRLQVHQTTWLAAMVLALIGFTSACGSDSTDEVVIEEVETSPTGRADVLAQNVILISLDTLRADRLGLMGYKKLTSPNLDALARRSVVFDRAQTQSSQTAPAHASLFTSEYPGAHRIVNAHTASRDLFTLPPHVTTLAEALSKEGVETAAFVSGGNLTKRMEMDRGFSVWDEKNEDISKRLNAMLEWIWAPDRGRFFVILHSYQVHAPYLPPQEFLERFVDRNYAGPLKARTEKYLALPQEEAWAAATGPAYWEGLLDYTPEDVRYLSDLYDAEIAYVDQELRRFLESYLGSELGATTALVVLSDHGEEFKEHGKYQHDQVYEEHLHVPLFFRLPGALEGQGWKGRVKHAVELVDVAPTIAELMGAGRDDDGWEGRSLVPLLSPNRDGAMWRSQPRFSELVVGPGPKYYHSITWQGWKYIRAWQKDINVEWEWLFHLEDDAKERVNMVEVESPEVQEALTQLREELLRHINAVQEKAVELGEGGMAEVDDDLRQMLKQLGYVR